jgi:hypothetical protein
LPVLPKESSRSSRATRSTCPDAQRSCADQMATDGNSIAGKAYGKRFTFNCLNNQAPMARDLRHCINEARSRSPIGPKSTRRIKMTKLEKLLCTARLRTTCGRERSTSLADDVRQLMRSKPEASDTHATQGSVGRAGATLVIAVAILALPGVAQTAKEVS